MVDEQLSGYELDAAVAERVLGCTLVRLSGDAVGIQEKDFAEWTDAQGGGYCQYLHHNGSSYDPPLYVLPRFSESIEAAMQVVRKMRERGWRVTLSDDDDRSRDDDWFVQFFKHDAEHFLIDEGTSMSLPEAICRAALAATEAIDQGGS